MSPQKPQFFGSSGFGLEFLVGQVALDRSRKTYEEEERRRLAQREAQRGREKSSIGSPELRPGNETANPRKDGDGSAQCPRLGEGWLQGGSPQAVNNGIESVTNQDKTVTVGQSETTINMASQETDYGDLELDSIDFDELNRVLQD
jgi:hypothetical protein